MKCESCNSEEVITYKLPTGEIKCYRCRSTVGFDVVGVLETHAKNFMETLLEQGMIKEGFTS